MALTAVGRRGAAMGGGRSEGRAGSQQRATLTQCLASIGGLCVSFCYHLQSLQMPFKHNDAQQQKKWNVFFFFCGQKTVIEYFSDKKKQFV